MSYGTDHDHRGEYASDNHDHYEYAEKHHRHYDDESAARGLREDLGAPRSASASWRTTCRRPQAADGTTSRNMPGGV